MYLLRVNEQLLNKNDSNVIALKIQEKSQLYLHLFTGQSNGLSNMAVMFAHKGL